MRDFLAHLEIISSLIFVMGLSRSRAATKTFAAGDTKNAFRLAEKAKHANWIAYATLVVVYTLTQLV